MNLSDATAISIGGKEVQELRIDGELVWSSGLWIRLTSDKSYVLAPETATITVYCPDLPSTSIGLFMVKDMTRTKLDDLTTDENGQATYTYTGTGAGEIGFVAVYDETDSNIVTIDDYTPAIDSITLASSANLVKQGNTITLTATVKDQHDQNIASGTLTIKKGTTTLGTASITDGTATYTYTGTGAGEISLTAEANSKTSNAVSVIDYAPVVTTVTNVVDNNNVSYGTSVTFTATVKDQYDQDITSGTVTFKNGSTTLGTGSISSGVATLTTSSLAVGSYSVTAEISNVTSTAVALNVNKLGTTTVLVPPTIYYKDEFDVGGTLKDANGTGLVGETVTLLWNDGTDHTETTTTTTGGVFSFHRDAPTSILTYNFKVTYAGDTNYNSSETGTSNVTVSKELTVVTITSPINGATFATDFTLTGTLKDDEGNVLDTSSTLNVFVTNPYTTPLGTATVENDGTFSFNVDIDDLSSSSNYNYISVSYTATTNYAASSASINVDKASYDGVGLSKTAGKQILSYADYSSSGNTEYCTVTAQLKSGNNNANISGVSVVFNKVDGSGNIISQLGTGTTDSNGQASYTYTSSGAGDIRVRADVGSLVTENFKIEDCINYDSMTSASGKWTIPSACSTAYDNNGAKFGTATSYSQVKLTEKLTNPCSVEFTLKDYYSGGTNDNALNVFQYTNGETTPNQGLMFGGKYNSSTMEALGTTISHTLVKGAVYKIEYGSSTMKVYENDVLLASNSNNVGLPTRFEFHIGQTQGRYIKIKDVKVKPL